MTGGRGCPCIHVNLKFNSLTPAPPPIPSTEKSLGRQRRHKVWAGTSRGANGSQSEKSSRGVLAPGGGEPGLCTPGRTRRCGFRLPASQPRTFPHQAPQRGYTFLHPALRPARPGSSPGALPALSSGLQSGGRGGPGRETLGVPGVALPPSQAHTGHGHPSGASKDTSSHSCPGWAVGLRVGVGERKAPSRTPPRPQAADPTAPPRAHTHRRAPPPEPLAKIPGETGPPRGGWGGNRRPC